MNMNVEAPVSGGEPSLISFLEESERLLIGRAQSGDEGARYELGRRNHGFLVNRCHEFSRRNKLPKRPAGDVSRTTAFPFLEWHELFAEAWLALSESIDRYDLAENVNLGTYARPWIDAALRRLGRSQYDLGVLDESNAGRWLRSNWHEDIEPGDVVKAVGGTILDAQRAIWQEEARRGEKAPYRAVYDSNAEGGYSGAGHEFQAEPSHLIGDSPGWTAVAADAPDAEPYVPRDDADWEHYCKRRAAANAQDRPGRKAQSFPAPLKPVSRSQYEADHVWAHRWVSSLNFKQRKEVFFRICVGERILYPLIGGWRPPRWSGEEPRPRRKDRNKTLECVGVTPEGWVLWQTRTGRVLQDLTKDYVVPSIPFKRLLPYFKRPKRGYSETALVKFKNGPARRVMRQKGGPVRQVELTPELCAVAVAGSSAQSGAMNGKLVTRVSAARHKGQAAFR
jgi:hypothetical protein